MKILILLFCILTFSVHAQSDQIQDKAVVKDQIRQDKATVELADDLEEKTTSTTLRQDEALITANAAQDAAAKIVTEEQDHRLDAIEGQLSGNQKFWLEILKTVGAIMTAIGLPLITVMLTRAQRDRNTVMHSVNGMSSKVATTARAEGFFEGAKLAARAHEDPRAAALLDERSKLIATDVDQLVKAGIKDIGTEPKS